MKRCLHIQIRSSGIGIQLANALHLPLSISHETHFEDLSNFPATVSTSTTCTTATTIEQYARRGANTSTTTLLHILRDPAFSRFGTVSACVKHTDGRTHDDSVYRAIIASCGKN